jgi:hypothetical protein
MSREFTGPLSKDDLLWARARLPEMQVERLIDLHGVKKGAKSEDALAKAQSDADEAAEKARLEGGEAADEALAAQRAAEAEEEMERAKAAADAANQPPAVTGLEDLIGDTSPKSFEVLGKTEAEVKEWAESADDESKAEALATEQGREDRDPRKGVVALLS